MAGISVVKQANREVERTVEIGVGPLGAGATTDGKRVYMACHGANHVAVIDTSTLTVIAQVPTEPVQVTVAPVRLRR